MADSAGSQAGSRKAPLSRELVLSTALALVDAEGLDALTMRRLGQELDRDPMSLYRYAANRAALLDGVSELVLDELAIFPDDPDWQSQLRKIAHDLRLLALRHPILRLGLHRLPAKSFPHLRALGPVLADYDGAAELDQGLAILLSGLAGQLSAGQRESPS